MSARAQSFRGLSLLTLAVSILACVVAFAQAPTKEAADLAAELDKAQMAYSLSKGQQFEELLGKYAKAEWDAAKAKGADADAKAKAGDKKGAIAAYREAATAFKDAIALAQLRDNTVKAAPIIEQLNATTDKYAAEQFLAQLELLIPSDARMPALREKVKGVTLPKETIIQLAPRVFLRLVLVNPGKFMMGSPNTEAGRSDDEGPQHEVTISKGFYLGACEVTQEQYAVFSWPNPSKFVDATKPVDQVNSEDAAAYCAKASAKTGKKFRLPTEAEWEYACRAGSKTRFDFGDDDASFADHGWSRASSENKSQQAGQKKPNAWGLYDMHGNVWEWCSDYHANYDAKAGSVDPKGPATGTSRVLRGGSWRTDPRLCRSAYRYINTPDFRSSEFGFRVVVELK
ncbi:MAG: formylglycine-generating enzyme family protein [Phycisphaerae bacterium]|nr:formylglycine-generating enzyme family protein [Phycisphaerae bacterium]